MKMQLTVFKTNVLTYRYTCIKTILIDEDILWHRTSVIISISYYSNMAFVFSFWLDNNHHGRYCIDVVLFSAFSVEQHRYFMHVFVTCRYGIANQNWARRERYDRIGHVL
jgi:hypothetical protein